MTPKEAIKYGTIVEVMSGKEIPLFGDWGEPLAVPMNFLAILGEPGVFAGVNRVKVAWGDKVLYASYRDIRFKTEVYGEQKV